VRDFVTGEPFPFFVHPAAGGGYLVTGTTLGSHAADVYIFRTDAAGAVMWARSYEHAPGVLRLSTGQDIVQSAAGRILVAGSMDKDRNLNQNNYPYFIEIDATGNLLHAAFFESNPFLPFQTGFSSVEPLPSGGFLFTGAGGYAGFGDHAQMLETDAAFTTAWSRVYAWDGAATLGSRSGRRASDGFFVFTGKRQMAGTVLMKTNTVGLLPCKNPGVLVPLPPSVLAVNRFPAVSPAVSSFAFPLFPVPAPGDTDVVCQPLIALPVSLTGFTGRFLDSRRVRLRWATASETNNRSFTVERSIDGTNYQERGLVAGAGTTTAPQSYVLDDDVPAASPQLFYRLRQTDFNGCMRYVGTVAVRCDASGAVSLQAVRYERASGSLSFSVQGAGDGPVALQLTDAIGWPVWQGFFDSPQPEDMTVAVGSLPPAVYLLVAQTPYGRTACKAVF
jgi:hypothetical protein